jgi:Domain of unknown function (DUF6431)
MTTPWKGGQSYMQILHPFAGSVHEYLQQLADPDLARPAQCPQCLAKQQLTAHGFYSRTLVDANFDGTIRVRRYLCETCKRTVSLLPEFALPYLRFGISVIAMFLVARILRDQTLQQAVNTGPYQRGQHWLRRFRARSQRLCASLPPIAAPVAAANFDKRAVHMLNAVDRGWTGAHRFLFGQLHDHLLGWPPSLARDNPRTALGSAIASG